MSLSPSPDTRVFDTKIAVVLRDDLTVWQKLNVTAFLASGVAYAHPELRGEAYQNASGNSSLPLLGQPVLVFQAGADGVLARARARELACALYTADMFQIGNDADNRAAVSRVEDGWWGWPSGGSAGWWTRP